MGGFPLSSGGELSLKYFLPGVQGEARVSPSSARGSVPLSEHLWGGGEKPSREVLRSRSHALRQRPAKAWSVPPSITACFPFPEIVCMLWMASPGSPGGPAAVWNVLVVLRWLTGGLCFQGGVRSLPSRDGERAAQLGEQGMGHWWPGAPVCSPSPCGCMNKVEHKLTHNQKVQNTPFLERITVA